MRSLVSAVAVAGLLLAAVPATAGNSGNCSPEGTWYGYNTDGQIWMVTINRSGPQSYTTVMDFGPNATTLPPFVTDFGDWRGEMVKTGPNTYDWTTMTLLRGDTSGGTPPFALGFCPLTAEFTGCDSWQGGGACEFFGYLSPEEDPFETGFSLGENPPLEAYFKRMPMKYPTP